MLYLLIREVFISCESFNVKVSQPQTSKRTKLLLTIKPFKRNYSGIISINDLKWSLNSKRALCIQCCRRTLNCKMETMVKSVYIYKRKKSSHLFVFIDRREIKTTSKDVNIYILSNLYNRLFYVFLLNIHEKCQKS